MKPSNATWIDSATLDEFRAGALASGYDEAIERVWAPNTVLETHTHPFDVQAVVVQGEMWLDDAEGSRHLCAGDHFTLARDTPHSERYGAEGATYWVARKGA
jgi:quercetin dioxygenase-like cupin family protein